MYCSIHKLNSIGIQTLEKSNLRACPFRRRRRKREAHNLPTGSKTDTVGRAQGTAALRSSENKAVRRKSCVSWAFLPPLVGLPRSQPSQAVQSKTTEVVSFNGNLSLRHGTALQGHPTAPGDRTPCLKLLCFSCFPREAGEKSVCTELVTATNQNSCPK